MLTRYIFTAFIEPEELTALKEALPSITILEEVYTLSFFSFQKRLFLYCETQAESFDPETLFPFLSPYLLANPGDENPRKWIQMLDIFHYNRPVTDEDWMRKQPMEPWVQLIHIRPEKISSYIYYHYQYQEEKPGDGNKYGMIAMHENLLCFYLENPDITDELTFEGSLKTHNTPEDWGAVMNPHFLKWEDIDPKLNWRNDVERLYYYIQAR